MTREEIIKKLVFAASSTLLTKRLYNTNLELAEYVKTRLFHDKSELYTEQFEAKDQMKVKFQFSEDGISISVPALANEKFRPVYIAYVSLPEDQLRALRELI